MNIQGRSNLLGYFHILVADQLLIHRLVHFNLLAIDALLHRSLHNISTSLTSFASLIFIPF